MNKIIQKLNDNKIVSLIKDYSSLFLLIITILGGAKQFVVLFYYSPTLTQYFSVSQVLIDGIALIIKFCIFLLGIFFYLSLFNYYGRLRHIIFFSLLQALLFIPLALSKISNLGFVIVNLFIIIIMGMLFTAIYINSKNEVQIDYESRYGGKIISISFFILCIAYIFFSEKKPNDIVNINVNTSEIRNKLPNAELIYFNDTYLIYGIRIQEKTPDYKKLYDSLRNKPNFDKRLLVIPPNRGGTNYSGFYIQKHETLFTD